VISGDPYGSGPYVVREKMPAGYAFPAHNHPGIENFTIISGTFNIGMGDKLDKKHAQTLRAGAFLSMPAKMVGEHRRRDPTSRPGAIGDHLCEPGRRSVHWSSLTITDQVPCARTNSPIRRRFLL
jgi:hypothetical protein